MSVFWNTMDDAVHRTIFNRCYMREYTKLSRDFFCNGFETFSDSTDETNEFLSILAI